MATAADAEPIQSKRGRRHGYRSVSRKDLIRRQCWNKEQWDRVIKCSEFTKEPAAAFVRRATMLLCSDIESKIAPEEVM